MSVDYEGIAIIGLAGRFPGAESVEEFWQNLVAGKETVSVFTDEELAESGLDAADLRRRGQYVPARGVLNHADCFDAAFFGVHPKEAEVMEPQQRVFLETCWAALERTGYAPGQIQVATAIFAGESRNTYYLHALHPRPDLIDLIGPEMVMYGNEKDYLTTRVAYKLGLKGPALNVSTACSTSLVAVCQACQSLLTYQCDMALAGGASVMVPQKRGYFYDEGNIGSSDGHTRTFDEKAAGTVFSNGVAVVVLKRLADAVKDGDQIFAVIKGAALNNDGAHRVSFGAPGVEGQSEVIAMAHALAGVDPETITNIEAHGTATPLGDPIEVSGLTKAFRLSTDAKNFCALGSVKTNIGHLDVAAGAAGLIKMALSLHHKRIPASLHYTKPNPKLSLEDSPFYVNASLQEWKTKPGVPRRGGVSSFGTGGTNAHVVLEEAPDLPPSGPSRPWQLLVLSAKTSEALDRATENLAGHLEAITSESAENAPAQLADAAFTLQTGRTEFVHRRIVVCDNPAEGAEALEKRDAKHVFDHQQRLRQPSVVFMFPGQGAQYAGMGAELYRVEPVFCAAVDRCADLLHPILKKDLRGVIFPESANQKKAEELLVQTRFTQPALFLIEYSLAQLWMSWGIKPASMIGHSVGEYVAACLAGVLSLEDALSLVARRGALVQALPGGAMLAVRQPESEVLPLLNSELAVAAINSPSLCVVAGPYDAIAELEKELGSRRVAVRHLPTSHAFHSPMMEPALAPFAEMLGQVDFSEPQIPYVSNVTAKWVTPEQAKSVDYWASHLRQTVRFAEGIAELLKGGRNVLLEVGPGQTLSTLARQHPDKSADQTVLPSLPLTGAMEQRGILESLGRLWMAGVEVDWPQFYANENRRRAVLPTYPFARTRYWPQSPEVIPPPALSVAPVVPRVVTQSSPEPVPQIPQAFPAAQQSANLAPAVPRKERLLAASRSLLQDLSGSDLSNVDASANLLELGLDSLLLTQASHLFQRKFGVSISFRQLMEELSSLDEIATYLDATMPPEAFAAPAPPAPVAQPQLGGAPIPSLAGDTKSALEQLLLQQQQLTNQVLQILGRAPAATAAAPPIAPIADSMPAQPQAAPSPSPPMKSHGPFKPIDKSAGSALSPAQSRALNALIERYVRRTATSKKLAAENRPVLADPRSVSGFNRLWKEMVYPISTTRSDGSKVWDVDENEYVDFVMGFGASMFGHRPPFVIKAVQEQLEKGFEIGPIQPLAGEVATLLKEFTGMPRVGFTNTGSEAVLAATRVARTVTGRDKVAVFAGAYHGIFDEVLFRPHKKDGEAAAAPIAPGIPASALDQVIVLDYGNPQTFDILRRRGAEIAAVLVEPVQSRRLDLQPKEFMHDLRHVTEEIGAALIFDEVVTGFRLHPGGAQAYFGVRADLATYGKVFGGGLPIGAVTGIPKFMDALDGGQWQYGDTSFPEVGVTFFAGTFVRHPLALAAAKAVLMHLKEAGPELQQRLTDRTARLADEIRTVMAEFDAAYHVTQFMSMIQVGLPSDQKFAGLLFYLLRERGIHIYENRAFVMTTAHSERDLSQLISAFRESLAELRSGNLLPPPSGSSAKVSPSSQKQLPESQAAEPAPVGALAQDSLETEFPLTEAQTEIWLAAQMSVAAAVAYNESLSLRFHGPFNVDAFRSAVHQALQRHPILLASIAADGRSQQIKSGVTVDVPLFDLSAHAGQAREQELARLIDQETHQPFELSAGPLLRVKIVRLSNDRHVVIWTAHHIVCDGWSGGLLISELARIYTASIQGVSPDLETPESFREYALESQVPGSVNDSIAYWRQKFLTLPSPLDLPADRVRPPVRTARAATTKRLLDRSLHQSLKRIAAKQRTTMVALLMAGLRTFLYRLSGQTDLVIGIMTAGQAVTGKTCLVGHCVNLLPIRSQLDPAKSFQQDLMTVKRDLLDAFDHQHCTIGSILQHLKVPRSTDRPPLVEVTFNVEKDAAEVNFQGLDCEIDRNPKRALHFDMFLNLVEGSRGILVECDFNTDLFDAATIDRWLGHYETLLRSVAENPTQSVSGMPLLTSAEANTITVEWNETETASPKEHTLQQLIEESAQKNSGSLALTCGSERLTYGELDRQANQLANHLQKAGIGPGSLVGVLLERSVDMVVAVLGILKAGAAYVPLDPMFPVSRLAYMVEDCGMGLLITHRRLHEKMPVKPATLIQLDADASEIARQSAERPHHDGTGDLAYILYTSGSTGKPKGVAIPHSAIVNFLLSMQREPAFSSTDTLLAVTTLSFDIAGLEIYLPLISGGKLVIASREETLDPARLMARMRESECTVMQATPATWRALIDAGWKGSPNLKLLCGGEALPQDLARQLLSRCGELWNMYGPTETTVWSTVHKVTSADASVPIGHPIANTQVFVLDANRNVVPVGVVGELYIGGAGVARGYLNRPELTSERFVESPFDPPARLYRTGDLARWLPNGTLECLGRVDNQVKIRGFRIELGEIEAVLARHDAIGQCVVVAREAASGDQALVAYFEARPQSAPDVAELRKHLKKELPDYMIPSAFVQMEKLPLTPNDKIDRKALPSPNYESSRPADEFVRPRTETENKLAGIWSEVLKIERLGVKDNFFELGGHSLLAIRVVSRIRDLFEVDLPPPTFFANATIAALATVVDEARHTTTAVVQRIPRRGHRGPSPLSFAQERIWFLDQLASGRPVYNIVDVVEFDGPSGPETIKRALNELIRRHEVLRTSFVEEDGQPVQIVSPAVDLKTREADLTILPEQEREQQWTRLAREQGRRPFDLSKAPLLRGTVVRLSEQHYLLLLAVHHIIADEWSMEVLHHELHQIHEAFAKNLPSPLPELPIQYADFTCWQREWLTEEVLDQQASYWKKELSGAPTILELPTDKPRPAVQTFRGSAEVIKFPKELLAPLKALGREEQSTLFMTLVASFMALLYRYTGQDDILVGTPISGRTLSETESLIGFFLNTTVLRGQFSDGLNFRSLLRQIKQRALGAYAHQDLPFGRLVAELAPNRDPSHSPLIQVMFILQSADATSQASKVAGIQKLETGTAKFDLTLFMSENDGALEGLVEYSTDLFEAATTKRLLEHYQVLLGAIAQNPEQSISLLPLLPAAEQQLLLKDWNATDITFAAKDRFLHQLIEVQAAKTPDQVVLVFEKQRWTYRQLNDRANQLANHLRAHGVGPGVFAGVLLERSAEMVAAVLAILKAGGAYVPLDPSFPQNRLSHMVEDSAMRVLCTHRHLDEKLPVKPPVIVRLDDDAKEIAKQGVAAPQAAAAGGLAYVLYTSGSTGKPKGVEIPHSAIVNFLLSMQSEPGFTPADTLLAVTTLSFDIAGLELYLPLISGGKLVIASREDTLDPARLMQRMRESSCTVMQATPATWRALIDAGWQGSPKLKLLCGGESCPMDLAQQLLSRCGELWNMYGPTETTVWSTVHKVTSAETSIPIGHPIANTQVHVLDSNRNLVPVGAVGELCIGGTGVARGYLHRPELTQDRFIPSPFDPNSRLYRTGDLARWLPDGTLECLGRVDNQVKVRGFRIELGEIEAVLGRHDSISQCVVVARQSSAGDKILAAYFESRPGSTPDIADLRNHLKKELPDYMIPSAFMRTEKLPLTPNGKIDRKALPSLDQGRVDVAGNYVAPSDPVEQSLAQMWAKVLKVNRVGIRDNFFELGGHSLLALRIIVEIEKLYHRRLPLATLLQSPTVGDLANVLRKEDWKPSWSCIVPIKPNGSKPPLFLLHSHGGNVLEYYPLANLLDAGQPVYGVQALGLDGRIVKDQSIETITSEYVKEIRTVQPRGPYFLGGFCFGGLVALEAAQQLSGAGEEVALVVLMQTTNPAVGHFRPEVTLPQQFWYRAAKRIDLERENLAHKGKNYFQERLEHGWNRAWARTAITLDKIRNGHAKQKPRPMSYILEALTLEHDRMADQYKIRLYKGDVVLFRASKQLHGLIADQDLGWKDILTGNLDICEIPGHQQTILTEPNVTRLAKELLLRLQTAQRELAAD